MADVDDNEIHVVESSPSVGKRLQQAREAKNFTVAEVAVQLRFTKDIVLALEKQQWEKLHGRTYARGYFTNYVKFLGLPADEMLAAFNIEYTVRDSEPRLTTTNVAGERQFPWVPIVILILMLLVGWFAYQQWRATQVKQTSKNQQSSESSDTTPTVSDNNFNASVVQPIKKSEAAPKSDKQAVQATTSGDVTAPGQAASDATSTEPSTVAPQTSAQPQTTATQQQTSVEQTAKPQSTTAQAAQAQTKSLLEIAFSGTCWVEVRNDASKVLVNKIMNANDNLKLTTTVPVHILLGKASVATVKFNQKPVDISSYIQGNVARFTLGADS